MDLIPIDTTVAVFDETFRTWSSVPWYVEDHSQSESGEFCYEVSPRNMEPLRASVKAWPRNVRLWNELDQKNREERWQTKD